MKSRRRAMAGDRGSSAAWVWWGALRARRKGPGGIADRQTARLAGLVSYARTRSAYYRELYRDLPEHIEDVTILPVTNKNELMTHFDDVATDPAVTLAGVQEFVADPERIGHRFAGKYLVATTAGTTGRRGIFVLDDRYWAVTSGLMGILGAKWLSWRDVVRMIRGGARFAGVVATGGHFLSVAASTREKQEKPRRHRSLGVFSVHTPLPLLVSQLNSFGPALLGGYASVLRLLATEAQAGRLRVHPVLVLSTAEGLPPDERDRLEKAFGAVVREVYGCTESGYCAYGCGQGWLHLLQDWVIIEPVDAAYRPVPPGTVSDTVLITNLANHVQPIIRYDVGDRVLVRPDPCPCGDPAPAIRVQGRSSDVLTFPAADGQGEVTVPPLALGTVVDRTPGVVLFQIVQTAPASLSVRLRPDPAADGERVRKAVLTGITTLLAGLGLTHVNVESAAEPPEQSTGGKYRTVIPLPSRPPSP